MATYRIQRGDTLSGLAQRHRTTVASLLKANPQIKNANLIYAGAALSIPGSRDEFVGPRRRGGDRPTAPVARPPPRANGPAPSRPAPSLPAAPSGTGRGGKAYSIAQSYLGHNISELKYRGSLAPYLAKWPGNNVSCANFVSACLNKAGFINGAQHNDNVRGLAGVLRKDQDFRESRSLKDARPGDVVVQRVKGKPYAHVVLFAGWKNGVPQFIGSNNVNADGTQRITQGPMPYGIDAVFHVR